MNIHVLAGGFSFRNFVPKLLHGYDFIIIFYFAKNTKSYILYDLVKMAINYFII